jgi:hypothetical protein
MRKYRIIEEKYEHGSRFYPQYKDENVAYYVLGSDETEKDIISEYQYFSTWEVCGFFGETKLFKKEVFSDLSMARHRIEIDKQEHIGEKKKETIIHEIE